MFRPTRPSSGYCSLAKTPTMYFLSWNMCMVSITSSTHHTNRVRRVLLTSFIPCSVRVLCSCVWAYVSQCAVILAVITYPTDVRSFPVVASGCHMLIVLFLTTTSSEHFRSITIFSLFMREDKPVVSYQSVSWCHFFIKWAILQETCHFHENQVTGSQLHSVIRIAYHQYAKLNGDLLPVT
jgi:hypothetical protein